MSEAAALNADVNAIDKSRRTWIAITCGATAVGGVATAVPFVSTFAPSERARAAGAPVQVDISAIKPGEKLTVEWRGKPVWIIRRTPEQVAALPKNDADESQAVWKFMQEQKPYGTEVAIPDDRLRYMQDLHVSVGTIKAALPNEKVADMSIAQDALKLLK